MFSAFTSQLAFLADATTPAPQGMDGASLLGSFWPFLVIIPIFYFFIIRPESKRKKTKATMLKELIVGDEITTIGGIVGRIVSIKDDTVTIETGAEKNKVKLMRWAISSKGEQVSDK